MGCAGCVVDPGNQANRNSVVSNTNTAASQAGSEMARKTDSEWAVTLPVLNAFFADESFADELKSKLELTGEQVNKLRAISQQATDELRKSGRENAEGYISSANARKKAESEISNVIGQEKVARLFDFVAERWSGGYAANGAPPVASAPWGVPVDTRIVVNAPAFRMDVFEKGQLIASYKVGIGYPEFPLPTGLRKADSIIFNPTWTPPDEPWVESPRSNVEVGETIEAGDKRNPLGRLKIPIGLPSLIHGGKSQSQIGGFASHGCVGLTDSQAIEFAKLLARLGGTELTDKEIVQYGKDRTETKTVKLNNPVPVELRYETVAVEDGNLHIYRDVYDRDTNTEQTLRAALAAYGATLEQLSEQELAQITDGLKQMSRDASGRTGASDQSNSNARAEASSKKNDSSGKVTRAIKGKKEVVIEIAALEGKGYPAPVDVQGGSARSKKAYRE